MLDRQQVVPVVAHMVALFAVANDDGFREIVLGEGRSPAVGERVSCSLGEISAVCGQTGANLFLEVTWRL